MNELLKVDHLTVDFSTDQGTVHAVRDVSFCVYPQEVLGIVGESGSGKSQTMYSVMGLLADNGKISGQIRTPSFDLRPLIGRALGPVKALRDAKGWPAEAFGSPDNAGK